KSISRQRLFAVFGAVRTVGINRTLLALAIDRPIEQFLKHLAVMHRRIAHRVALHQLIRGVRIDMIFVAVVRLFILLRPARINILLTLLCWLLLPRLRRLPRLAAGVLFPSISLTRPFD